MSDPSNVRRRWGILAVSVLMFLLVLVAGNKGSPYQLFWIYIGYLAYKGRSDDIFRWVKVVAIINAVILSAFALFVKSDSDVFGMLNTNTKEGLLIGAGSLLAVKLCIILYLGYDDKKEKSRQILSVKNVGKARVTDNINIFKIYRKFVFVFVFGIIVSVEAVCYFDGEIKTIFIGCEVGSKMSPEVLTYTLKNNDVIEKTEGTFNYGRDKREKYVELKKLDDCVVLDKNNWQCGGKSPDWDKDWIREQFTVFDGLFNYHPAKFKEDKRRSACGETFDQIKWYLKWYYW